MRGVVEREKRYVTVIARTDEEGRVTPLTVIWRDGVHYDIDKVLDVRQACSLKTGGTGMRYTVKVGGQPTYLFYEGPRWFVEAKVVPLP